MPVRIVRNGRCRRAFLRPEGRAPVALTALTRLKPCDAEPEKQAKLESADRLQERVATSGEVLGRFENFRGDRRDSLCFGCCSAHTARSMAGARNPITRRPERLRYRGSK